MIDSVPVVATRLVDGKTIRAEFFRDTGRLSIVEDNIEQTVWFPPHSWFAIASVSGHSRWGTTPNEQDLRLLIDNFVAERRFNLARGRTASANMPFVIYCSP
jgi:hypothetical protein